MTYVPCKILNCYAATACVQHSLQWGHYVLNFSIPVLLPVSVPCQHRLSQPSTLVVGLQPALCLCGQVHSCTNIHVLTCTRQAGESILVQKNEIVRTAGKSIIQMLLRGIKSLWVVLSSLLCVSKNRTATINMT